MQTHIFNSQVPVSFREDGYLNATAIAAHFGKQPRDYLKTEQTQEYIVALAEFLSTKTKILVEENQLVTVVNGGNSRGTWLHPKLAVHFASWLDARFAVWCDMKIEEIISGSLKLSPAQKQQIQQAVMARHHRTGEHWQEIYRKLHSFCQVNSYHEIAAADFDRALGYLNSIQDAPEVFRQPQAARFEDHEVARLATVVYYCNWACRLLEEVSAPLKALGYGKALTMWTIADESISFLRGSREALERELPNITDSYYRNHIRHSLCRFDAVQTI
ncbi:KilA-N domain-containing protein [Neisseria shayeganii]|uniref:Phage related protein KilA n=1 Tax=Neisseria shayeganii 871 TaxID=1032488 RepID=G4CG58_9NEIS|nr:KilA-N domain-containing protein [Neisseria shayeganii]EGY53106.1 phage related protein KilA [Neisseria shayeganii 871]